MSGSVDETGASRTATGCRFGAIGAVSVAVGFCDDVVAEPGRPDRRFSAFAGRWASATSPAFRGTGRSAVAPAA